MDNQDLNQNATPDQAEQPGLIGSHAQYIKASAVVSSYSIMLT